jgi:hypothetical protein
MIFIPIPKHWVLLSFLCLIGSNAIKGQNKALYRYQDLSQFYYQKQKDSIKKAWTCPSVYKDREVQKKYKEIWDQRTDFFSTAITDNNYIYDEEISAYIEDIVAQIQRDNKQYIPVRPFVILDRSASVNAYALGSNVLAINLGLISFAKTREEIALTIAHELSHNILNHPENSMKKSAEWFTSDEYKKSIDQIKDSDYGRLTLLKKVFENYSFSRSRHQRYHEGDADSLAIVLLNNSHISFDPNFFMRMDSADIQYRQPLKQPVKSYFNAYNITIDDAWMKKRSKGLSTKAYDFQENSKLADSVKTHPDCIERYNRTVGRRPANPVATPVPAAISNKVNKMLIWNMYCNYSLASCLYSILLEKDKNGADEWYDFMLHNVVQSLYESDKELHRFASVGVKQKEYISKDYYELQTLMEQIPRDKLEESCKSLQNAVFWSKMQGPEKALKSLLATLSTEEEANRKLAKEFIANNNTSLYCEFAHQFEKK